VSVPGGRTGRRPGRFVLFALLAAALGLAALSAARLAYPLPYRELIEQEALRFGFDPLFLAAVIHVESRFDPFAVSRRGALGLMQLLPETAAWAAGPEELFHPATNVRLGTWLLADLRRSFRGDMVLALAAYNAGAGSVRQWLREGTVTSSPASTGERIAAIPYPETRRFVERVLVTYRIYRLLYRPWDLWPR
jgi:soluble lytic murein transglycosylase